jgi:hypothetical protein
MSLLGSRALPDVTDDIADNANRESEIDFEKTLSRGSSANCCTDWGNSDVCLSDEDKHDKDETHP